MSASAAEIKKIIGLWEAYHLPILESHFREGEPSASGPLLWGIFSEVWDAMRTLSTNSNKINNYGASLIEKLDTWFLQLSTKNQVAPHVHAILEFLGGKGCNKEAPIHMLPLLSGCCKALPEEQAAVLLGTLLNFISNKKDFSAYNKTRVLHFIFDDFHKTEAIKAFLPDFPVSDQYPEYNFRLIDLLIQEQNYESALEKCLAISKFRFHPNYSIHLEERLITIYSTTGEKLPLLKLLQTRLGKHFFWEDYQRVVPLLEEGPERQGFIAKIRRLAIEQMEASYGAQEFLIRLAEEDSTLLHTLLQKDGLLRLYINHFDVFFHYDQQALLIRLLRVDNGRYWYFDRESEDLLSEATELIKAHWDRDVITRKAYELRTSFPRKIFPVIRQLSAYTGVK